MRGILSASALVCCTPRVPNSQGVFKTIHIKLQCSIVKSSILRVETIVNICQALRAAKAQLRARQGAASEAPHRRLRLTNAKSLCGCTYSSLPTFEKLLLRQRRAQLFPGLFRPIPGDEGGATLSFRPWLFHSYPPPLCSRHLKFGCELCEAFLFGRSV